MKGHQWGQGILIKEHGAVHAVITARNPQANSIVERMHQVLNRDEFPPDLQLVLP